MVFELSQGTDRSIRQSGNAPVVFSDTYDNLLTYIYNSDYSEHRNYAYIYGEGEGAQRKSAVCYDTEEIPTGFDRYEIYVNARDLSQTVRNDAGTDTALTSEEYREMLWSVERKALSRRCCPAKRRLRHKTTSLLMA